jgi:hypothetical protein
MLPEALEALAAAGGSAVVQAAGTDVWTGFRDRLARLFGRGDEHDAGRAAERLDQAAAALEQAGEVEAEQMRARLEVSWQTQLEDLLESLTGPEREEAAGQLRELVELARQQAAGSVSAGEGGIAAGRDVTISAEGGSVAGGVIHGGVSLGHPSRPGPDQG